MSETEEIAKAVQSVAKLGEQSLATSEKLGGFIAKVFSEPVSEVAGMVTDKLRFARWKRMVSMSDEVQEILDRRGIENTRAVPPKLALPLLEEASLEDEPELQKLWNNLLANAMDPSYDGEIRTAHSEIIKSITHNDAAILHLVHNTLRSDGKARVDLLDATGIGRDSISQILNLSSEKYLVSVNNLMRVQCLTPLVRKLGLGHGISAGDETHLTVNKGVEIVCLTPLGLQFIETCTDGAG